MMNTSITTNFLEKELALIETWSSMLPNSSRITSTKSEDSKLSFFSTVHNSEHEFVDGQFWSGQSLVSGQHIIVIDEWKSNIVLNSAM